MKDFPAAHSMDTEWFAVDRDGHVAHFVSGEAGAVPNDGYLGEDYGEVREQLNGLPQHAPVLDPDSRFAPEHNAPRHVGMVGNLPLLVFLDTLDPLREELARGEAEEWRATRGVAVVLRAPTAELMERLHRSDACRGCTVGFAHEAPSGVDEEPWVDPARVGFFAYEHLAENIYAGPYGRGRVPSAPVKLEQLPPAVQEVVGRVRLDVCFAETGQLQPAKHAACAAWDGAWVDLEAKQLKPCPGQEETFLENYGPEGTLGGDAQDFGLTVAEVKGPVGLRRAESGGPERRRLSRPVVVFGGALVLVVLLNLLRSCLG